ncbi:MAG: site-specific integrase [Hyphomicrobiales bacterium]|nr:site-specific integrase [Hyphomicrobiales bacterium]
MLTKFKRGHVWYIRGTVRGIRIYETAGTSDHDRAEEYRARREAQLWDRSVSGERGQHSFGEAVLIYLQSNNPGPSYRATLLRLVNHFERWPVDKITQGAVDEYVAKNHSESAPGTIIRAVITPLTAVLRVAAKRQWCDFPAFDRPKVQKSTTRFLTPQEARTLASCCAGHLRPLVIFLTHTGARLGEALRLKWSEVDLNARRVMFLRTKNGESRGVPLNDDAFLALANLAHREGHVFLTPAAKPYHDTRGLGGSPIKRAFKTACKRAGIEGLRVHDLRHTFASWLVMNGTPLRTVAELLGHKSLSMVHRYSHLSPDHLADAVASLSNRASCVQSENGAAQAIDKQ